MRVRILKTAAGPNGIFVMGEIGDWPEDVLRGIEYEVIKPVKLPEQVVEAAVPEVEVETAAVEVKPTGRRGKPPRTARS